MTAKWVSVALLLLICVASSRSGRGAETVANPVGDWHGSYICAQGMTALDLSVTSSAPGQVQALFHFTATPSNPDVPEGCFSMRGSYEPTTRRMQLLPTAWLLRPDGYVTVGLDGQLDRSGGTIVGRVTQMSSCTTFSLLRASTPMVRPDACRPTPLAGAERSEAAN